MGTNDAQINYKMSECDGVNLLVGGKSHKDSHLHKEMGWRKSPEGRVPTSQESLRDGEKKTEVLFKPWLHRNTTVIANAHSCMWGYYCDVYTL